MSCCCCRTRAAGGCARALASQAQSLGHVIWTSRFVPQHTAQIGLARAGQPRRARLVPQRGHNTAAQSLHVCEVCMCAKCAGNFRRVRVFCRRQSVTPWQFRYT